MEADGVDRVLLLKIVQHLGTRGSKDFLRGILHSLPSERDEDKLSQKATTCSNFSTRFLYASTR